LSKESYVVAYGGEDDRAVLDYAIDRAKRDGAKLVIVHILEWSPYKFLTPQELEERHVRRKQELERAKAALIDPAIKRAADSGVEATCELRYGGVVDLLVEIATKTAASLIVVGRGAGGVTARVFGSVPIGMAQIAPVPTVIVP
jgi:nucleotide-binding universal stress UspA family protein